MPLGTHPGRIRATKLNLSPHHGDAANAQPFTGFTVRRPSPGAAVLVGAADLRFSALSPLIFRVPLPKAIHRVSTGDLKPGASGSVTDMGLFRQPEIYR